MDRTNYHKTQRQAEMRSYSRTVNWLKILLPIGAVLLIGLIFLAGRDRFDVNPLEQGFDAAALGAGLKLENPRFAGVTSDGAPFVVTAASALPDGASPDRIELELPEGEVRLDDGMTLTVESVTGEMFRLQELLNLEGDVVLRSSDGYRADAQRVELDMRNRTAFVPGHVVGTGPRGAIEADSLRITQPDPAVRDVTAIFTGNVKVTIQPAE